MGIGAVVAAVAPSVIGAIAGRGERKAAQAGADASLAATREGIEAQERALEQLRSDLAPFTGLGVGAIPMLQSALGLPQAIPAGLPAPAQPAVESPDISPERIPEGGGFFQRAVRAARPADQAEGGPTPLGGGVFQMPRPTTGLPARPSVPSEDDIARIQDIEDQIASLRSKRSALGGQQRHYMQIQDFTNRIEALESERDTLRQDFGLPTARQVAGLSTTPFTPQGQPATGEVMPAAEFQAPTNELLEAARARALAGREANPLLVQAEQMALSGPTALDETLLQNPLLRALQDDVTERLMARRAAAGKLGTGGTARALQAALVPQAIQFGLQQEGLRQQQLGNLQSLGLAREDLSQRDLANLQSLGLTQEDLRQRGIENLFRTVGLGQSAAARTGSAGLTTAGNIGKLGQAGALAQGEFGQQGAEARSESLGLFAEQLPGIISEFQ